MDVDEEALRTGVVRAVDPTTGKTVTVILSAATVAAIALASPSPAVRAQARAALPPSPTGLNFPVRKAGRNLSKLSGLGDEVTTSADWLPRETGEGDDSGALDANRPSTSQKESNQRHDEHVTKQRVWKDGASKKMGKMQKRKGDRRRLDAMNDYEEYGFPPDLANKMGGGGFSAKGRFDDKVVDDPGNTDGGFAYKPVILGDWVRFDSPRQRSHPGNTVSCNV